MSLAMWHRLPLGQDTINTEGIKASTGQLTLCQEATKQLAIGLDEQTLFVGEYLEADRKIKASKDHTPEGMSKKRHSAGQEVVKKLEEALEARSRPANSHLNGLDRILNVVDTGNSTPEHLKSFLLMKFDTMPKSERHAFADKAFTEDNKPLIRAILDYVDVFPDSFPIGTVDGWKNRLAETRNPDVALERAQIKEDIGKLTRRASVAIGKVKSDAGIDDGTLQDRMNKANDAIRESQTRRTESTADQVSQTNARSVHAPGVPA